MNEPLLLLPGMMCDARLFASHIAAFSMARSVIVAPLTVIPGAGHLPILEQPERTKEELKQWLNT
jgi:pimeloyl-ACP methyl ester carboxylesterase